MRRENYLFESYFMRLEKEHANNEEEDKKKAKDRKKDEKKGSLYLSPEEKY
jgi:hypothetical protein